MLSCPHTTLTGYGCFWALQQSEIKIRRLENDAGGMEETL